MVIPARAVRGVGIGDGPRAQSASTRTPSESRAESPSPPAGNEASVPPRIYLSSPHMGVIEERLVAEAFATNWIAPLGPHVDAFESEFGEAVGARHAVALSSGTAALHLSLILAGVGRGDEVMVSTLTFSASVNPIVYLGARPVFVDSERSSWNMDPALLSEELERRAKLGRLPKAVMVVHLYGQSADLDPIVAVCARYDVTLIEDAAEALGATYRGRPPGTFGRMGIYSFNGNKIITTSGGGMLVCDDEELAVHARKLATQARDAAPHYQHSEIGYNYRLSNVLAAIGRGQLQVLGDRIAARRAHFEYSRRELGSISGVEFMPEAEWGSHTRWLTALTIDPSLCGVDRETVRCGLEEHGIESRPVWKPMHLQPVFADYQRIGGAVSEQLFENGLCLPSGSNLTPEDLGRVVDCFRTATHSVTRAPLRFPRGLINNVPAADRASAGVATVQQLCTPQYGVAVR
jgi:dTDP-4-amino-4,6-dideoxygalactose transaminase